MTRSFKGANHIDAHYLAVVLGTSAADAGAPLPFFSSKYLLVLDPSCTPSRLSLPPRIHNLRIKWREKRAHHGFRILRLRRSGLGGRCGHVLLDGTLNT